MYLDDLRTPIEDFDYIVRSFEEAIAIFKKYGIPSILYFLYKERNELLQWFF